MLNEWLLGFARWLDAQSLSTQLHESYYMYAWVETTHVLTLAIFLGMLMVIDLRMLGWAFSSVPATTVAKRLDTPMMIGFAVMVVTGIALFYAIPVRSTQSIWFRIKVVLLIAAGVNALLFRRRIQALPAAEDQRARLPARFRTGAALSLAFWAGVVICGRTIAYDWFDCHKDLSNFMYWAAGCVDELAASQ